MTLTGNIISWTPSATGSFSVTAVATDPFGKSASQSWTVTVTGNQPPVFTGTVATAGTVGAVYTTTLQATDPDGDPLTFSLTTAPTGMTISGAVITWTPASGQKGDNAVTASVSDGKGGTDSRSWTIKVHP
jgi:hypothetical protein